MTIISNIKCQKCGYVQEVIIGCATIEDYPEYHEKSPFQTLLYRLFRKSEKKFKDVICKKCGSNKWVYVEV